MIINFCLPVSLHAHFPYSDNRKYTPEAALDSCKKRANELKKVNVDSALHLLDEGVQFFRSNNHKKAQGELLYEICLLHNSTGHLQQAELAGEECLNLFTQINSKKHIALVSNMLGVIQARKSDYQTATGLFLKALSIFSTLNPPDTQGIISSYIKLGLVNDYTGNFNQSIKFYEKGLKLARQIFDTVNIIHLYNNLGVLHAKRGEHKKAFTFFNNSLEWTKNKEDELISPLMNIGNIFSTMGGVESDQKSLNYFNKALQIAKKYKRSEDIIRLEINISGVIYKQEPEVALRKLEEIIANPLLQMTPQLQIDALNQLIEINEDIGNYKKALQFWKKRTLLLDSLSSMQQAKEIADLQSVYDLQLSREKLNELEQSNKRNASQRNMIFIFTVIILAVLVVLIYIYKRRNDLNKLLIKREEQLKRASETKDRIFTIIGHDLRNAVGNVPALIEIYKDAGTTDTEKEFILENLQLNATATFETLNNMLEWGKAQIKGVLVDRKTFNASHAISHTVRLFTIAIQQKNIRFIDSVPREINLYTDEAHFTFIIRNLLSNAIKFTDKGGSVEIGVLRSEAADEIILFVRDNGVGVEQNQMEYIFSTGGMSTAGTSQEGGSGLGLMLCREFVQKSNGRIWASSIPGQGTTMYVTFTKYTNQPHI